jgi:DNA repair exonuclease SbcCD ATPase subunit
LSRQEARFFDEKYKPMTVKLETEIGILTDLILSKDREIEQQKEKARALVDKISEVEVESIKIHDTEMQARAEFEKSMLSLERMLDKVRGIRKGLSYEIRVSKRILSEQANELASINASIASLSDNEKEVERKIMLAKSRIDEQEKDLESINVSLNETRKTRETIKSRMNEVYSIFNPERLNEIEESINSMSQLEAKLEACRQEYSNELAELKKQSKENAESVEKLRDTIQVNFARKMARELERLGTDYEENMSVAFDDEKDIRRRIDNAKEELKNQVERAKELSRRLEELVPKGRDITDARMMQELKDIERMEKAEDKKTNDTGGKSEKRIKLIDDAKDAFTKFRGKLQEKWNAIGIGNQSKNS